MSRFFNGPFAVDSLTFSVGSAPLDQGPITVAALCRSNSTNFTAWVATGRTAGARIWSALFSNNSGAKMYMEGDFGTGGPISANGKWAWAVWTKASGSVKPRFHFLNITDALAWVHVDGSANVADGTGPITSLVVGSDGSGSASTTWRGEIAAVAAWGSVLNDAAVEAAFTLSAADLAAANPDWGVLLNQASTSDSVVDFTGNGGNQTAIVGTAVDADEPPGWSYDLGGDDPLPFTVWNGSSELEVGSVAVWNGSSEVPVTLDTIV